MTIILSVPVLDDARPAIGSELQPNTIEKQATTQAIDSTTIITDRKSVKAETESIGAQKPLLWSGSGNSKCCCVPCAAPNSFFFLLETLTTYTEL
jgi:hypothetical protein